MNTLLFTLLFLSTFFSFNFITSASTPSPYQAHCASVVPESIPVKFKPSAFPLPQLHTGYFKGGDTILRTSSSWQQNTFSLQTNKVHQTQTSGLIKIEATLTFISSNRHYYGETSRFGSYYSRNNGKVVFKLDGFWSESSGRLCMVGKGKGYSQHGDFLHLDAVFELSNLFSSSNVTSLIHGRLVSLSSADIQERYFEPISVLMLPKKNYKYSLDSEEVERDFASDKNDGEEGLPLDPSSFCSRRVSSAIRQLHLEHPIDCHLHSAKNCYPKVGVNGPSRGSIISLDEIECSSHTDKPRLRVLVRFPYDDYYYGFEPVNVTGQTPMFVGEGWWDETKNQILVVACNFMGVTDSSSSLAGAHVGDCSIRLRLKFPSVLSIKNTSRIVGLIWSNKTEKDLVKFDDGLGGSNVVFQGLKYEYTQLERVKKYCPSRHNHVKNQENRYPDAYYMRTHSSVRESKKKIGWGYSSPLAVGEEIYRDPYIMSIDSSTGTSVSQTYEDVSNTTVFNISFTMTLYSNSMLEDRKSLFNKSSTSARISAEGTYDAETGSLCMIGCRNLVLNFSETPKADDSLDCEILVKFEFPPLAAARRSHAKGSIESTRKSSDPLYFKVLNLTAYTYYTQGADTAWRMDMEIIMVLLSTVLACAFLVSQLIHVKRHPDVLPLISLTMVSILTFGHMVPLVLNFEAVFTQDPNNKNFVFGNVGWFQLEVNETTVRLLTMVVFLLLVRFLRITWSARKVDEESHKSLWAAEKKTACVILPLYALCFLIALLLKSKNNYEASSFQRHSSWEGLKHFGGLVLDGFLLPQIMFNLFSNMKENALSCWFYFGTSFVRMLPHAYDLYRDHNYDEQDNGSYYYADPSADYYSTAWDIVIPLGSFLFAIIILLQQRFGGSCVLPRRFRRSQEGYQKVPMATIPEEGGEKENEKDGEEAVEASNV